MQIIKSIIIIISLLIIINNQSFATHNRAGEITYEQVDDLTIIATITTYTRTSSFAADRDSLELFWGDGTSNFVRRSNGNGEELPNDIKKNTYIASHTYPTRSRFKLSVTDPNRIAGIQNIDFPNSINIQFYLETTLTLLDRRFQGDNNSAILLQPPIDFACAGQPFIHNPNAFDPDGDSLSYELITPFQSEGLEVPNYNLPDEVAPADDNVISLDPITGDFNWESPPVLGDFNITILIKEYRNGILINEIIRDMQILVLSCFDDNLEQNNVPTLETVDEICVIAGELIEFDVLSEDIDSNQLLTLSALGSPFILDSNDVSFDISINPKSSPITGTFRWQTECDDISESYYQVVFKSTDNFLGFQGGAATLKTVRIKILGPSPTGVEVEKISSSDIAISWDNPYQCDQTDLFQGFSIWRSTRSQEINIDSCRGGLQGSGYQKIIFLTNEIIDGRYRVIDTDVPDSDIFCYRIVAEFAELTPTGNPFNQTESLPSEEACVLFNRRKPYITKTSVLETATDQGAIEVNWVLPNPDDIDTIENSAPFIVSVSSGTGLNNTSLVNIPQASSSSDSFGGLIGDTIYIDENLNTVGDGHSYQVNFENSTGFSTSSSIASSLLLTIEAGDESLMLSWDSRVPWDNKFYNIYQVIGNEQQLIIDSITETRYRITGLLNGEESCYVVESIGTYGVNEIRSPIINFSQEVCARPRDLEAPCLPSLEIITACQQDIFQGNTFINEVSWLYNENDCPEATDTRSIVILFSPSENDPLIEIDRVSVSDQAFNHNIDDNISGCYAIQAIDSSGNISVQSGMICVDNCPSYALPNTFTPNGDNSNDVFTPTINRFIDKIELEVYNRWGQIVYRTEDPAINWDGTNLGGSLLSEGTYYYTCVVFESRVTGIVQQPDVLKGFIQIIN